MFLCVCFLSKLLNDAYILTRGDVNKDTLPVSCYMENHICSPPQFSCCYWHLIAVRKGNVIAFLRILSTYIRVSDFWYFTWMCFVFAWCSSAYSTELCYCLSLCMLCMLFLCNFVYLTSLLCSCKVIMRCMLILYFKTLTTRWKSFVFHSD